MTNMTKKELLNLAKEAGVTGRHDMSKEQLIEALDFGADVEATETEDNAPTLDDQYPGNYIPTPPYRARIYKHIGTNEEIYKVLPPQAKRIFDYMRDSEVADRGENIVKEAVQKGYLKTTQDKATLFAFYARRLEEAGICLFTE